MARAARKVTPLETDEQRRSRERAAPVLRAREPSDPTGEHRATCREIADAAGVDVADVIETWAEIAAVRQYERTQPRFAAERDAIDDVRAIYRPRQRALL